MTDIEVTRTILDDIREFVEEKWKHSECEICGTDSWGVNPEPLSYAHFTVGADLAPNVIPAPSVGALMLNCTNCGNIRFVAKWTFDQWRAERTKK